MTEAETETGAAGPLERRFEPGAHGTSLRTEILAALFVARFIWLSEG